MPPLTDLTKVRAILDRDPAWAAYAIGDLAPGFTEHCTWHAPPDEASALLLVYRGFDPPIAFAMGDPRELSALFREIAAPAISLHVRPETLAAMADTYVPTSTRRMLRMVLSPHAFRQAAPDNVVVLDEHDADAVAALYAHGQLQGDGPTFFHPTMLRQGTFRGVWEGGRLTSVAGTHLYSRELGVCAIGNVYTRADRRGRGLAARATSAVVEHALRERVPTIVLNVGRDNIRAQRVYERLGFEPYCEFLEGEATRTERERSEQTISARWPPQRSG